MNISPEHIRQIAESLLLHYTVFFHKRTSKIIALPPLAGPFASKEEGIQGKYEQIMSNEASYLRILPPTETIFYADLYWSFCNDIGVAEKVADNVSGSFLHDKPKQFDKEGFFRAIEKEGKMQQWLAHELKLYEWHVKQCLYPYQLNLLSTN